MSNMAVGKEILSFCNRCQLKLAHIIAAMKDISTPAKVICKTCGSNHSHKQASAPTKRDSVLKKKKVSKGSVSNSQDWQQATSKPNVSFKKYSPSQKFAIGEGLEHATFGRGIVEKVVDGDKIYVLFESDVKTLIHNRE